MTASSLPVWTVNYSLTVQKIGSKPISNPTVRYFPYSEYQLSQKTQQLENHSCPSVIPPPQVQIKKAPTARRGGILRCSSFTDIMVCLMTSTSKRQWTAHSYGFRAFHCKIHMKKCADSRIFHTNAFSESNISINECCLWTLFVCSAPSPDRIPLPHNPEPPQGKTNSGTRGKYWCPFMFIRGSVLSPTLKKAAADSRDIFLLLSPPTVYSFNYPFTLPAASPCTKYFWKAMNTIRTGISVITDIAKT